MVNESEISKLRRLRGALKTKLTRFENFLNKSLNEIDVIELRGKLTESEFLKQNFEDLQTRLEALVLDAEIDAQYEERGDFEDMLSAVSAKAKRLLILKEPLNQNDQIQITKCQFFNSRIIC